jgi:hypothetical protein
VSAKLPVLKDQGVYLYDDVNDERDEGGVIRESVLMRLKTAFQMSTSGAFLMTSRDSARYCSKLKSPLRTHLKSVDSSEAKSPCPIFERNSRAASWP